MTAPVRNPPASAVGRINRGFLIIAIPAFLVSLFWLTLGWGWHTAVIGGCLEIAIGVGVVIYAARRPSGPAKSDTGR
jgi:hypothetical protein